MYILNAEQCFAKHILGEKCDVRLEVFLETNLDKLYDILVLHLDGGKDMFITISADCQRTSFTTSISSLVRIPIPILHLSPEQFKNAVSCSVHFYSIFHIKICSGKPALTSIIFDT